MNTQIERVARAFYDALYGEGVWENELEELKDQFRDDALAAIALLDQGQYGLNGMPTAAQGTAAVATLSCSSRAA